MRGLSLPIVLQITQIWALSYLANGELDLTVPIGSCSRQAYFEDIFLLKDLIPREMSSYKALVFGGTGGIGQGIVRALARCSGYDKVTLILRKEIALPASNDTENYSKFEQKIMNFDKIPDQQDLFTGHDVAFYSIGVSTTAVNEATYRKIELENALEIAKLIKSSGIKDVHWVTGKGTKENSWFLFGRVKAEVEKEISGMDFRRAVFYRPAAVCTPEKPWAFFQAINFCGSMAIHRDVMGEVIVANSLAPGEKPVDIMENPDMLKMHKKIES